MSTDYLFVAFRPDLFGPPADTFERQVTQLIERIKATPRRPGVDDIRIPSERAFRSRERALREGLEIDRLVFDELVALRTRQGAPESRLSSESSRIRAARQSHKSSKSSGTRDGAQGAGKALV
jgi:LDH2 family malate/lactate/ureidoglycolate dehydrogenase